MSAGLFPLTLRIARVCHEANRALCAALGDRSQRPWEDAPEWQVESAFNGVRFILDHPDAQPGDSHASWLAEKEREGWVWGPEKDEVTRTHPCMVPFEELPEEQRFKDVLFVAIVRALSSLPDPRADFDAGFRAGLREGKTP